MSRFLDALDSGRVLLMDGAMGTELQSAGLRPEACGELWNVTHADCVRDIHQRYVAAGAEVLLTNTFQSHPLHLARFACEDRLEEINRSALRLARKAVGARRFVLADIGPIFTPNSAMEFADRPVYARVLASLEGADGFLLETCSSPHALFAVEYALHRVAEIDSAPLLLALTYERSPSGRLVTRSGHAPEIFARHASRHGVAALGVNCGRNVALDDIREILRRYRQETDLPLFARPNAGTPSQTDGVWIYPHTPERMAACLSELLALGVCMLGGCCGTTPAHIAAFQPLVADWNRRWGHCQNINPPEKP